MRRIVIVSLASIVPLLAVACGGAVSTDLFSGAGDGGGGGDGGAGGGDDSGGGSDAGPSTDAAPSGSCPAALPRAGSSCSTPNLGCEYNGVGDHILCSTVATCLENNKGPGGGLAWDVTPPDARCVGAQSQNSALCPPSFGTLPTGALCPVDSSSMCVYPEGECTCVPCATGTGGGTSKEWACEAWPTPANCPEPRPRIGSACTTQAQSCPYGAPCGITSALPYLTCDDGAWRRTPVAADCALRRCGR